MGRDLDVTYCHQVRRAGVHGRWEPGNRLDVGDVGTFRRGVFTRWLSLQHLGLSVPNTPGPPIAQSLATSGVRLQAASAGADLQDAFDLVLGGKAQVSFDVGGGDEVLLLMGTGRWYETDNRLDLQAWLQQNITNVPVDSVVVCDVYRTTTAVVGVSARNTGSFTVSLGAAGRPVLAAAVRGQAAAARKRLIDVRRTFVLPEQPAAPDGREPYGLLFRQGFRIRRRFWGLFGRSELLDANGQPVAERIAQADPVDRAFNPTSPEADLDTIQSLALDELFEDVTVERVDEDVAAEQGDTPLTAGAV